ncbi:hypothetical protein JJJ17_12705 [Paracoccus caeni]|uniref:Uncharacterized protein n=1 Tax=Paracoccus caeni TaxID=657651 RepID=A0A934SG45_9RHOB|nr:hypothetical protein [Paracoccus caeni]MBK4216790.1 hypothetical protein [Paracoccus caeni]
MNFIAISLIAASITAGAVSAADFGHTSERPDPVVRQAEAVKTVTVDAATIYSAKELGRANLKAEDKVTVTDFSSDSQNRVYER